MRSVTADFLLTSSDVSVIYPLDSDTSMCANMKA
jgi:hypothetical protein